MRFQKIILLLISLLLLSSCAIHDKFPFLCFRGSCIKKQWGVYKIKAFKKRFQASARGMKKKMAKNANKRHKNDTYYDNPADTVNFYMGPDGRIPRIKIVVTATERKDSVMARYMPDVGEIMEDDKKTIKNYIESSKAENVIKVVIQMPLEKNENGKHAEYHLKQKAKQTVKYIEKQGVNRGRIIVEGVK